MAERKRRWRLLLGLGLGLVLLLGVAWQVAKRLLDVDQYRSLATEELERFTGLPVAIGRLDLVLRPIPALSAFDVSIGEGDLEAVAARVDVLPELGALWERRLEIASVDLGGLELTLPADADRLEARWETLARRIEVASEPAPTATTSLWTSLLSGFALHRVRADDVLVRLDASAEPRIRASVRVAGLADAEVHVDLDGSVPELGARIAGQLRIPSQTGGDSGPEGEFTLHAGWPDDVSGLPEALRSDLEATAQLRGRSVKDLRLVVEGTLEPRAPGAFSGAVTGEARLTDGALGAEFASKGPELRLAGSVRGGEDGTALLRIDSLDTDRAGVTALIEWLGTEFVELSAAKDASLEVRDLALRFGPDGGAPRLVSGSLSASHVDAVLAGQPLAQGIELRLGAEEGGVAIQTLRGGPFDLTGDVRVAPDWSQFDVVLRGDVELTGDLLEHVGASGLEDVSGRIRLEELRQAFPAQALRDVLPGLRAQVRNASLRVVGEGFSDELSGIDLRVATEGAELRVEGGARSRALGDVGASASWKAGTRRGRARITLDPTQAEGFGPPDLWQAVEPLLRAWGSDGVEILASWPEPPAMPPLSLRLDHATEPTLHAELGLRPERRDDVLGDVNVDAEVPAELFHLLLPDGVEVAGDAALQLRRDAARASFSVDADLGAMDLRSGHFVDKSAGEALRVKLLGDAPAHELRLKRVTLESAKAALPFEWRGERLVASDFDVDLADWAFLLTQGASASGRLRGSFATNPLETRVDLSDVALRLSPELAIDAADGTIALDESGWSVQELRVRGAGSDVVVDAALEGDQIHGRIGGASLDVDLVRTLVEEVRALLPESTEEAAPMRGTLAVELDHIRVGGSEARGVDTQIHFDGEEIHVPAFEFETYEGRVTGALDVAAEPEGPRRLDLKLGIEGVTGRFLDDFFFEAAPRGIRGTFDGTLEFSAPLADDIKAMLAAGDGRLAWTARNGSFGKLGFATKIATALRASEALRLRLPAMKDEGLVFDTVKADFPLKQGLLRIELFELDTIAYAISATGTLDFARDRSDVPIEVNVSKGLTPFLEKVPIAGDVLQIVNVRLQATGSPYDLSIHMASFKDQVVRASLAGPNSMIKRVRDAMALLKGTNGNAKPPAPEPAPEPSVAPEATAPAGGSTTDEPGAEAPPDIVPEAPPEAADEPAAADTGADGESRAADREEAPAEED